MMINSTSFFQLLVLVQNIGKKILDIQTSGQFTVSKKLDSSLVTDIDIQVNAILTEFLSIHFNKMQIISEEADFTGILQENYILIDPIDGTKSFIEGTEFYSINVSFVHKSRPIAGIAYFPKIDILYWTLGGESAKISAGQQVYLKPQEILPKPKQISIICNQRTKTSPYFKDILDSIKRQSIEISQIDTMYTSLKYFLVAEGKYDLVISLGDLREWDVGPSDACVLNLGLKTWGLNKPFKYGQDLGFYRPYFAISRYEIDFNHTRGTVTPA